jgi:two-component system chemotaxis response regulator CheB
VTDPIDNMPATVDRDMAAQTNGERRGDPSVYSCPECGGVLWQVDQEDLVRFRCHVGHAYYGQRLLEAQAEALEAALWTAVRTFRERATLSRQLAAQERRRGNGVAAHRFDEQAELADRNGELIRRHLLDAETGLIAEHVEGKTKPAPGPRQAQESDNGPAEQET